MKRLFLFICLAAAFAVSLPAANHGDVAMLIILGQSNADGSAFSEPAIDKEMWQWYTTAPQAKDLHIWYRSTQVKNESDGARHVVNGKITDMQPGWMRLWYRNDNVARRTAMNMIHGAGSYSDMAQGRRGIEGEFGRRFTEDFPAQELYVVKLGVSGSSIDSWANKADDHNWNYFLDSVYTPAISQLLLEGKHPRLAGVWWMQGCADQAMTEAKYSERLDTLYNRLNSKLGFRDVPLYIGTILAPGENPSYSDGSRGFGEGVRAAQQKFAAQHPRATLVNTSDCPMQYEDNFNGYIHFNHQGVNRIAQHLADSIKQHGESAWAPYIGPTAKWKKVWEETFDSSEINPAIWSKIPRGTANWDDCMSDADTLYAVRDGCLMLRGMNSYPALRDTSAYVTGGLFTKDKKAFGYGRLEIEAKLGSAIGAWPAFWLLPDPDGSELSSWPNGGEIDIMEHLNHDGFVYQTVHNPYTLNKNNPDIPCHFGTAPIKQDDFNVYTVEMYPDRLSFFVNDVHTFTYPRVPELGPEQFPFNHPFYLLIDMQLGGSWVGKVNPDQLPVEMLINRVTYLTEQP